MLDAAENAVKRYEGRSDEEKNRAAYDAALDEVTRQASESLEAVKPAAEQDVKTYKPGFVRSAEAAGVAHAFTRRLDRLGKAFGVSYVYDASLGDGVSGVKQGNVVRLNPNANIWDAWVVAHETGHVMKTQATAEWGDLQAYLVQLDAKQTGRSQEDRTADIQKIYENHGQELTAEEAREEIACDMLGDLLQDERLFDGFLRDVERGSVKPGVAQKIIDALRDILDRIRHGSASLNAAEELGLTKQEIRRAMDKLSAVAKVAGENENAAREGGGVDVKFSFKKIQLLKEADVRALLEESVNGVYENGSYIPLRRNTPAKLISEVNRHFEGRVSVENLPVIINVGKLRQAMEEDIGRGKERNRQHGISVDGMIEIIKGMDDPSYIVYQENGRYAEVIKYYDEKGKHAYFLIDFGDFKHATYMNGYESGKFNVLVTAFHPDNLQAYINKPGCEIIYDKAKDSPQSGSGSLLPSHLNGKSFINNIPQNSENSNVSVEENENAAREGGGVKYSFDRYTEHQLENWAKSKKIVVYTDEAQLRMFIQDALDGKNLGKKMYFGKIGSDLASRIEADTGQNVEGFNCSITAYEIRKILKNSHGNETYENMRGQRAVTVEDILYIPDIITSPDKVLLSDQTYEGRPVILFEKETNGRTTVVSYVSQKHMDLTVQTMYVGKNKKGLSTPLSRTSSSPQTSETSGGTAFNYNIPHSPPKSNTQKTFLDETREYKRELERMKRRVEYQAEAEKIKRESAQLVGSARAELRAAVRRDVESKLQASGAPESMAEPLTRLLLEERITDAQRALLNAEPAAQSILTQYAASEPEPVARARAKLAAAEETGVSRLLELAEAGRTGYNAIKETDVKAGESYGREGEDQSGGRGDYQLGVSASRTDGGGRETYESSKGEVGEAFRRRIDASGGLWKIQKHGSGQIAYRPIKEDTITETQQVAAEQFYQCGVELILTDGPYESCFNGRVSVGIDAITVGNCVYISNLTEFDPNNIFKHEIIHVMKNVLPDLYDELYDVGS